MDEQLVLDTAEAAAPALRGLAREILEAEARSLGVSLDDGDVVAPEPREFPSCTSLGRPTSCSST